MKTLIFDIETKGEDWDAIDTNTQQIVSRWIHNSAYSQEEKTQRLHILKEELGLSPLTGTIVAIGVYDVQRERGAVYYTGKRGEEYTEESYVFKERSEKEMLKDFWEGALSYDTFVTFNGRSFDIPYILHRSVACDVVPTVNLIQARFLEQQKEVRHIDLQEQLTFYRTMPKRPSLHLFCRAYGIDSPEVINGTSAQQSAHKVAATTELYKKWLEYLAPDFFKKLSP